MLTVLCSYLINTRSEVNDAQQTRCSEPGDGALVRGLPPIPSGKAVAVAPIIGRGSYFMKIVLAIISISLGLYFLGSTVRMFPLGTIRPLFVPPTTFVDVVNGTLTVLFF